MNGARGISRPDVCIIGLGAAGGVAAHVLTSAGLDVVGLEAGPHWAKEDFAPDEMTMYNRRNTLGAKFNSELQTLRPDEETPTRPADYSLGKMMNGVGGGSVHWGAWARRFFPTDFLIRSATIERYGEEALPPDADVVDWPFTYEDLEPYYTKAEYALGVSGGAYRVNGKLVDTEHGNALEADRSAPFPMPPLRSFGWGERFKDASRRLGLHPFNVPAGVNSIPYDGRPACTYCGFCSGYGCYNDAKASTLVTTIPKAVETGRLDIRPFSRVVRVNTDASGKAKSVDYIGPAGTLERIEARAFLLSAYTTENIRLLFLSASDTFPDGLGNEKGLLGKFFMTHQYVEVMALFDEEINRFTGPTPQAVALDDYNADFFDHTGLGFIRGGAIGMENQTHPIGASENVPPGAPGWGRSYKEWILRNWNKVTFLRAQPESLAYASNYMDLDPVARDTSGIGLPVMRFTYRQRDNELRMIDFLQDRMGEILTEMGAHEVWKGRTWTGVGSSHDYGGCRMGSDAATSVCDGFGRLHDTPNLFVLGGATFNSCAGQNPTLTIAAMAWRTADRVVEDLTQ
ncbi:MAG: GMC family oxidoreductase [Chloroflexi bacterium]|nr:GMC family oxidoreductase [Chloroflexota bacterium]